MVAKLQLALDFINMSQALRVAKEAVYKGIDMIEAGTPLIKSEGLQAVRQLKADFPDRTIVADMKVMDAGRVETEAAAKAGADIIHVLAAAADSTIKECVDSARRYDANICVDLIGAVSQEALIKRAKEIEKLGVQSVCVHTPIDQQMQAESPFNLLKAVAEAVSIPVAVAGGINSENAPLAVENGASIVIVGGAITKAADAGAATEKIKNAVESGIPDETDMFKRFGESGIGEVLGKTAAADVTEALHNSGAIDGIRPVVQGAKMAGPALTVWTYPGDWAKPVEAIDQAQDGQVIVIDSGGRPPAVWGEKATMSSLQRNLAGVVIDGAIRDVMNIRRLGFPAFARTITPVAGEPKGQGMIGVPINIGGQYIRTGDWIVGDDDGVVVIPREKVIEVANRAQSVLERESREMSEIEEGSTLGRISELMRWEKVKKEDSRNK